MTQWYFHVPGQTDRVGPLDDLAAQRYAQATPQAKTWCEGMSGWMAISDVPELRADAAVPGSVAPPPFPSRDARTRRADDI
ncbi:DUF4339 domain-containing protein, partial [Xanthomonas citri pv. citri]